MRSCLALTLALAVTAACREKRETAPPTDDETAAVVKRYAEVALASYTAALDGARRLRESVDHFVGAPDRAGLEGARQAWLAARVPYLRTEAFRFYGGPIDRVEPFVNSWPIDESYIDYAIEAQGAGIVNDRSHYPALSADLFMSLNEREGEKNISTGFHAIEFLLWGQDTNDSGPGARPVSDYTDERRGAQRRKQYLQITAALLVKHMEQVAAEWADGRPANFRARLMAMPHEQALGLIIKGVGMLAGPELAGERLTVPYETKDQENEHSCFSDNTHNDVILDIEGIENVYLGRPPGAPIGSSLRDLVARRDPALANGIAQGIAAALAAARAVPPPFDRAILGVDGTPGRVAILKTITALQAASDSLAQAAAALKVRMTFDDPKARTGSL